MNLELLNKMRCLNEQEIYTQLYTDHLTGVMNRRAFEEDGRPFVAVVDLDSLKYVNDELGHRWGDYQLVQLAKGLALEFGNDNVYRLSGDEFAIKADHAVSLRHKLVHLREMLPGFSFGIGLGVVRADTLLKEDKRRREEAGQRAARGECPPWIGSLEAAAQCQ